MKKRVIGLIGGIASGKSTLASVYVKKGAEYISADEISRALVAPGSRVLTEIVEHFGPGVIDEQGELNRAALAERIFENDRERLWIEALIHPNVRAEIAARIKVSSAAEIYVEIPVLKDRADYPMLDEVWCLDVPGDVQLKRLMARDQLSEDDAKRRIAAGVPREKNLAMADRVISLSDLNASGVSD